LAGLAAFGALAAVTFAAPAQAGFWNRHSHRHHGHQLKGSGNVVSRTLNLKGFDAIVVKGVADIDVALGTDMTVELSAEDNLIERVDAHVDGRSLIIDTRDWDGIDTEEGIHLRIVMPELTRVEVQGVSNVDVRGLDARQLTLQLAGVGNIEVAGKAEDLEVQLAGVGKMDLRDLVAQSARVHAGGIGEVELNVARELDAHVNGMSKVRYHGDPQHVHEDVEGFGSLAQAR
jgi:hypothetical protein